MGAIVLKDAREYLQDTKEQQKRLREYILSLNMEAAEDMLVNDLINMLPTVTGSYTRYIRDLDGNIIEAEMHNYTEIPDNMFENCATLERVTFIDSPIYRIGKSAFKNCTSLKMLEFPIHCTIIDHYAFYNCSQFEPKLTENISFVGNYAFAFSAITEIPAGVSLWTLCHNCFYSCKQLTSVVLPDREGNYFDGIFQDCYNLESINLPSNMTKIPDHFLHNCKKLAFTISDLPPTLSEIGINAFRNTKCNIETFPPLPEDATSLWIGTGAFMSCTELGNVVIPEYASLGPCIYSFAILQSLDFKCAIDDSFYFVSRNEDNFFCKIPHIIFEKDIEAFTAYEGLKFTTEIWLRSGVKNISISSEGTDNANKDPRIFKNCSPNLTIYVEATSAPNTWCTGWNKFADNTDIPVVYGVTECPW